MSDGSNVIAQEDKMVLVNEKMLEEMTERAKRANELRVGAEAQASEFCASREFFKSAHAATLDHAHKLDRRVAELERQLADFTLRLREAHDAGAKSALDAMSLAWRGGGQFDFEKAARDYWARRDAVISSKG